MQQVVARFQDGTLLRGSTGNFRPNAPRFHIRLRDTNEVVEVEAASLKALFFVRDLDGNPDGRGREDVDRVGLGRKVRVEFADGEVMHGYTTGYSPARAAFWVTPADPESNNDRAYVVAAATTGVEFLD